MTVEAGDHFDGERFFNPSGAAAQPLSAVPQMLAESRRPWPSHIDTPLRQPSPLSGAAAVVTFIGHSTFLIQTAEGNILTDPMYSERASPLSFVGPRRVRPPAVPFDELPRISTVLLSHNHYDHCDRWTLGAARKAFRSAGGDAAEEWSAAPVVRHPQGRRARLVAGEQGGGVPDRVDAGAPFFGAHAVRSKPRVVGRVRVRGRRPPPLLRRRQRLRAVLFGDSSAPRSDRSGPAADRRLRAALVHAVRAHESCRSRSGPSGRHGVSEHRHAFRDVSADQSRESTSRCSRSRTRVAPARFHHRDFERSSSASRCGSNPTRQAEGHDDHDV